MALAPFFDKAALSASTMLQAFDREAFARKLTQCVVGLAFDRQAVETAEGSNTLELSLNLLARLYPRLAILPLDSEARARTPALEELARQINPNIEFETAVDTAVWLCVGRTPTEPLGSPVVYVGSDGWVSRLSNRAPVGSSGTSNPVGAAAAACFGAANVFRAVFRDQLECGALDTEFSLSLLDLCPNAAMPANPALTAVSLGEAYLVGAGAIGNAALWVLGRVPDLTGVLNVVDGETIELSNLQRYVLASMSDVNVRKVDLVERAFDHRPRGAPKSGLKTNGHAVNWGRFLGSRSQPWLLDRVAVALDSALDRCAVQASLPRRIINAWTQPGDLGVSQHEFFGLGGCLACLYLPDRKVPSEDQLVSEAIGLSAQEDIQEIRKLLYYGSPVGEEFIRRISSALGVATEPLLPYVGRPLRDFYREAVCGGVLLSLKANASQNRPTEVPMVFQSALAGVLLAAGMIGNAAGLPTIPAGSKAVIDLLRALPPYLRVPIAKRADGRCFCQDDDYRAAYTAKYGPAGAALALG